MRTSWQQCTQISAPLGIGAPQLGQEASPTVVSASHWRSRALADVAFLAVVPRRADCEVGSQRGVSGVGGRTDQVHGGGYGGLGFQAARIALTLGDHRILEGAPQEVVVAGGIGREQQRHRTPEHLPDRIGGELGGRPALL